MSYDPRQLPTGRMNPPSGRSYPPPQFAPPPVPPGQPAWGWQQQGQQYGPPMQFMPAGPPNKKKPNAPLIIAAVVVVAFGLCAVGIFSGNSSPGSKTTADQPAAAKAAGKTPAGKATGKPQQPDTYNVAIGSAITVHDGDNTVKATLRSVKTYTEACSGFGPDPEQGRFVVVDLLVEQTGGEGSVNPLDFTFVGDDGTTANGLSAAFSGCDEPSLASTNSLRAGQKRAGRIAFDANSSSGSLEWAPGGLGADTAGSWKVGG